MTIKINRTENYHIHEIDSLSWEVTVCNSLEVKNCIIQSVLKKSDTFGNLFLNFINNHINPGKINNIIEIGGGYGFLMRDILTRINDVSAVMLDISQFLIDKQRETLRNFNVGYMNKDVFKTENSFFEEFNLAILNENAGDFPTIFNIEADILKKQEVKLTKEESIVKNYFIKYSFPFPEGNFFTFNIGAVEVLEKLCTSEVDYIFLSEHSCEAKPPSEYSDYLDIVSSGNPERIQLKGHNEYTIKFSLLEKIAEKLGYNSIRGSLADFIELDYSERLRSILASNLQLDEHEIIRHFVYDLFKYEFLFLEKL